MNEHKSELTNFNTSSISMREILGLQAVRAEQLQKLNDAIKFHLCDSDTKMVRGHYRGHEADLHYNSRTQNIVVLDKNGKVIAGFKASAAQAHYINSTERLN